MGELAVEERRVHVHRDRGGVGGGRGAPEPEVVVAAVDLRQVQARAVPVDGAGLAVVPGEERDVLLLLARGRSNAEIAVALFVGEATVKTHVGNVLAKLGLRDRVQAVILAYETGLVVPGDPAR